MMDRRRMALWAILVGASLTSVYSLSGLRPATRPAAARVPTVASQPASAAAVAALPSTAPAPAPPLTEAALSAWRSAHPAAPRDPFFSRADATATPARAIASSPALPPEYTVTLVMTVGSDRMAFIGDEMVKVGDRLGDERVAEILSDVVVLERGGERRQLPVGVSATVPKERAR